MFQEYEADTVLWALQTHKTRPNLLVSFFPPHLIRISQKTFSHRWDLISQKYPSKLSLTSVLRSPLAQRLEAKLLLKPSQALKEMGSFYPRARRTFRPCRTWWSWPGKDSPLLSGTLTLAMFRQQGSQVSSGSFLSPAPGSFSYTEPGCGWAESESHSSTHSCWFWSKRRSCGAHFPAVRCRYNQADIFEIIHKFQLLREFLDSRY